MKTIIVATDFSPAASNAANYAADIALAINADIYLLHVYQLPVSYGEVPVPMNYEDICKDYETGIKELKDQLIRRTEGKLNVKTEVRTGIFFHQELKDVCEKVKPYTVIMGSQGSTAVQHLIFGNHTAHAMKHLMWPLITVPPNATFSSIKKIGLACDLHNVKDTTPIDEISILVNDFHAELHILNIEKHEGFNSKTDFESVLLEELLGNLKHDYHFITNVNTDEAIMDFVEKNNIDLLIVLPRRHGLPNSLIHKSHAKQLVLHSHVPVMALHNEML